MKLDRHINKDGHGKYALIQMRKVDALKEGGILRSYIDNALAILGNHNLLHYGNEGEGEQFFVLKYKDIFAAPALRAYAEAVLNEIRRNFNPTISGKILIGEPLTEAEVKQHQASITIIRNLSPYWSDMCSEAVAADGQGVRIPD